jgi:hypothetical protein
MLDLTCLMDTGGFRIDVIINKAWSTRCSDPSGSMTIDVTIPHQD